MKECIHPLHTDIEPPRELNNPFRYEPHPLCLLAAEEVKKYVYAHEELLRDAEEGEMFGVMIVATQEGHIGFIAAYAGLLAGRNDWAWFVPPIFDAQQPDGHFKQQERLISDLNHELLELHEYKDNRNNNNNEFNELNKKNKDEDERERRIQELKRRRKEMSNELLLWLFEQYNLVNYKGEVRNVVDIWRSYHNSPKLLRKFPLPPGGTGECCAPKLFQYAYSNGLEPLAVAEFWWGKSPKREIRHHFQFYPACNGKCRPILTWQIKSQAPLNPPKGGEVQCGGTHPLTSPPLGGRGAYVQTLFVDDQIAVVVKPEGLLSVPGNTGETSLYDMMRQRFPQATGAMMVHRLDQATSGVMVVARTEFAYKQLQRQFEQRQVGKRYVAMLQAKSDMPLSQRVGEKGTIRLPLAPDYLDRPRQLVDYEEGKPAVTDYEIIGDEGPYLRVRLTPHTGRTHQLRVHCAHPDGLGMPIVGDDLYGFHSDRLYLHAEYLAFRHPLTDEPMEFQKAPDF